ncbi:MAG: EpsG family protein [Clostridia bacterium]|nr:EpsG family protein [Clostridia bacterium]
MIIWILLIVYLIFLKLGMGELDTKPKQKQYLIWAGVAVALIMGLRGDNYGRVYDLRVYTEFFELIDRVSWRNIYDVSDFEVGFVFLNKVLACIFTGGQTIIIFEAFFCVFAVCHFIYHNTDNVFEALFFFVTLGTMGFMLTGLRQSIAIGVGLLSVQAIKNKQFIKYAILMAIAYSIHETSIVFFVAYFIFRNKAIQKNGFVVIPLVLLMMVLAPQILKLGVTLSDGELSMSSEAMFSINGIVPILIYVIAISFTIYINKCKKKTASASPDACEKGKGEISIALPMTSIGLGVYLMRFYGMVIERLSFYYTPASVIALADIAGAMKKGKDGTFDELIILFLAIVLFIYRLSDAVYGNYVFFWNV